MRTILELGVRLLESNGVVEEPESTFASILDGVPGEILVERTRDIGGQSDIVDRALGAGGG